MAKEQPKREGKQLLLRFSERSDLRERLSAVADQNNRSLSAEIIFRLEASLQGWQQANVLPDPDIEGRLGALEKAMLAMIGNISDINDKLDDKSRCAF
ncbi:MAG TPA: Arc family DNA-binding protein [Sphingobium sp.]|nr:Arc family DNA-binding protein [Sphingobium sp.]